LTIHLVGLTDIDRAWPLIAPGMAKAIIRSHAINSVGKLFKDCRCGAKLLYIFENDGRAEASMIVDVDGDLMKVIAFARIEGAPRRLKEWMHEFVEHDWKGKLGVTRMRTEGRCGWERAVPGIRPIRTLYELVFEDTK
jgi:hypothetical protein